MPELSIDGHTVTFEPGQTVLDAARLAGVEIPSLCFLPGRAPQTSCFLCVVRVNGGSRLLPSCATMAAAGMAVESETPDVLSARRTAIELLLSDHLGDCVAPCRGICPAHMDMPGMTRLIAQRRFRDAIALVKQQIALPAVLGRICPELCEKGCRRTARDGAVSICLLKRFVADRDLASNEPWLPECKPDSGKRVGILGAGPAGLAAAWHLQQEGHSCTLYDDHEEPGGALRYAIPEEKMPRNVLDNEIALIMRIGAVFMGGRAVSVEELVARYDAVLIAGGSNSSGNLKEWLAISPKDEKVFVAGTVTSPSKFAVRAVAEGHEASRQITAFLANETLTKREKEFSVHVGKLTAAEVEPFVAVSQPWGRVTPSDGNFEGLSEEEAVREAARCLHCDCSKAVGCKLRECAVKLDANPLRFRGERREFVQDATHPAVLFESGKCIACGICVRIASEAKEQLGLTFMGRGFTVRAGAPFGENLVDALKTTALECADACPTGALVRSNKD